MPLGPRPNIVGRRVGRRRCPIVIGHALRTQRWAHREAHAAAALVPIFDIVDAVPLGGNEVKIDPKSRAQYLAVLPSMLSCLHAGMGVPVLRETLYISL
jgi:hypothetical protein